MNFDVKKLTRTSLLLALAIVFQTLGRAYPFASQFMVGPAVNAIFILCLLMNGLGWSLLVAMLTPVLAWSLGQLPAPLGPIVPVIALGNISFILVFNFSRWILRKQTMLINIISVVFASFAKFTLIFLGVKAAMELLNLAPQAVKAATKLMGINQFITALTGGVLAVLLVRIVKARTQGTVSAS